jgi:hypothetical protein
MGEGRARGSVAIHEIQPHAPEFSAGYRALEVGFEPQMNRIPGSYEIIVLYQIVTCIYAAN